MRVERERIIGESPLPWVRHEHAARYSFASTYVAKRDVIDCACGDGTSSVLFAKTATRVHAFDISPEAVDTASQTHGADNVDYRVGDACALPIEPQSADVYVSLETIEHLPDDEPFLREVVRVLADGGTFICSTPDRDVTNPGKTIGHRPWNRFHVREYSFDEFAALLGRFFTEVRFFGQNPNPRRAVAFKGRLGRVLPGNLVVRWNQFLKLRWMLRDRPEFHEVTALDEQNRYEYLVAVCAGPRRPES